MERRPRMNLDAPAATSAGWNDLGRLRDEPFI